MGGGFSSTNAQMYVYNLRGISIGIGVHVLPFAHLRGGGGRREAGRGPKIEIGAATQVRSASALGLGPIESIPGSFPWTVPRSVCTACTLI